MCSLHTYVDCTMRGTSLTRIKLQAHIRSGTHLPAQANRPISALYPNSLLASPLPPPLPIPPSYSFSLPSPDQINTASGQPAIHLSKDAFRGTKQRSAAKVYQQIMDGSRVTVLLADDIIIPSSLK